MNFNQYETELTQLAAAEDCIGKTVAAACVLYNGGNGLGLRFADGTFYVLKLESWADGEIIVYEDQLPHVYDASRLGIVAPDEYDRVMLEEGARREQKERKEYERLKAKFEPKGDTP